MTALPLLKALHPQRLAPGLALSTLVAAAALWAGVWPQLADAGLSALTLAIVAGMVLGNTIYPRLQARCDSGVQFAKLHLLRTGIVLYGLRVTFGEIARVGLSGVMIDVLTLASTFFLACLLGPRFFGLDRQTSWLIGAGSSICGAAAVLATEPVVKADAAKVTVAVATVVISGTLAIVIYPALWPLAQGFFSPDTYGIYIGSTVHEVAQVVAAGHAIGPDAENTAVIAKMLRVMMLAPFLLFLTARVKRLTAVGKSTQAQIAIPWFALLFIAVAVINSLHLLPDAMVQALSALDTLLLAMAMAALGLSTHVSALRQAGLKPILLALCLFGWLLLGGGAINLAVHALAG